jgi:hypothetical protein
MRADRGLEPVLKTFSQSRDVEKTSSTSSFPPSTLMVGAPEDFENGINEVGHGDSQMVCYGRPCSHSH